MVLEGFKPEDAQPQITTLVAGWVLVLGKATSPPVYSICFSVVVCRSVVGTRDCRSVGSGSVH